MKQERRRYLLDSANFDTKFSYIGSSFCVLLIEFIFFELILKTILSNPIQFYLGLMQVALEFN